MLIQANVVVSLTAIKIGTAWGVLPQAFLLWENDSEPINAQNSDRLFDLSDYYFRFDYGAFLSYFCF